MAEVTFTDCAGLSLIVRARNRLRAGASLIVRSPSTAVRRLFKIANVDRVCEPAVQCQPAATASRRTTAWTFTCCQRTRISWPSDG